MTNSLDISYKGLLKVAVPISLGTFVQFVVSFTDNYFVAQLNGNAMSAVSFVGLIYITLVMIGIGLGNAAQILIARRKGEGLYDEAGEVTGNAFRLAFVIAIVQFFILFFLIPEVLDVFISHDEVRVYMKEFITYRSFGFFFYALTLILNSFWSGIAQTRVMIWTTTITAIVNIVLDYGLIFGNLGFPEMGVKGAALATSIAEAVAFVFILIYTLYNYDKYHQSSPASSYRLKEWLKQGSWRYSSVLIKLGGPISLQMLLSLGLWGVFYGFVETMGESELQASFIVRQMYMLVYISIGGFSTTAKTYISGLIAERRQHDLRKVIVRLMVLNLCGVIFFSHGLWVYPYFIAEQFTDNVLTIQQTVDTMHIVLPAMLTFSFTSILLATVEGSGNTVAGFLVELITVIIYIVAAYAMVFPLKWPVHLVWTADYVYFILIGLFSWLFLYNGKWKYKKV